MNTKELWGANSKTGDANQPQTLFNRIYACFVLCSNFNENVKVSFLTVRYLSYKFQNNFRLNLYQ